jgi:hypothetical protein
MLESYQASAMPARWGPVAIEPGWRADPAYLIPFSAELD